MPSDMLDLDLKDVLAAYGRQDFTQVEYAEAVIPLLPNAMR